MKLYGIKNNGRWTFSEANVTNRNATHYTCIFESAIIPINSDERFEDLRNEVLTLRLEILRLKRLVPTKQKDPWED